MYWRSKRKRGLYIGFMTTAGSPLVARQTRDSHVRLPIDCANRLCQSLFRPSLVASITCCMLSPPPTAPGRAERECDKDVVREHANRGHQMQVGMLIKESGGQPGTCPKSERDGQAHHYCPLGRSGYTPVYSNAPTSAECELKETPHRLRCRPASRHTIHEDAAHPDR